MVNCFKRLLSLVDIDKKLAFISLGLGLIVLLLAATAFGSIFLAMISVTLILASGVYLLLRGRRRSTSDDSIEAQSVPLLQPRFNRLLDIAFWGMLIACLLLISQQVYVRPLSFLILVSIMSAILGIQIFAKQNTAYSLVKILIIAMLLRASVWYQFPGPVGRDAIVELDYVGQLVSAGHVNENMGKYVSYPVAHILSAATHLITGLGLKDSFFILGIVEVISLVFVFLIGRKLFDKRIGLFAALIMAICDWHIRYGYWMKGMTLGIALLPILLFLLLNSRRKGMARPLLIFSIVVIFLSILTHTLSSFVTITILVVAWLSSLIIRALLGKDKFESPVTIYIVLLSTVVLLGYWTFATGYFGYYADIFVDRILNIDVVVGQTIIDDRSAWTLILQNLPKLIPIFFTIIGCLFIFGIEKTGRKALSQIWLALIAGIMVVLTFILNYFGVFGPLVPVRWFVFMSLLTAVPVAIGLLRILGRKGWPNLGVLFLSVLVFAGIMVTSYQANITQVVPWVTQSRDAFIMSEMAAADTVSQKASLSLDQTGQGETSLHTDYYYWILLHYQSHVPTYKLVGASPIFKEEASEYQGILLLRSAATDTILMTFGSNHYYSEMEQFHYQALIDDAQAIMIYNNGQVQALKRS